MKHESADAVIRFVTVVSASVVLAIPTEWVDQIKGIVGVDAI